MKYQNTLIQANKLLKEIQPYCKKVEIVGDLRRRCPEVYSIDILAEPRQEEVVDLFGDVVQAYDFIEEWVADCGLHFSKNGRKYKQFLWQDVWVNLYLTSHYQWGLHLAIRTGCELYAKWLVCSGDKGGALPPEMQIREGWVWFRNKQIPTLSEPDFYEVIETEWIRPELRSADVWRG